MLPQKLHQRKAKSHQRRNPSRMQRKPQKQAVVVADQRALQALKRKRRRRNECMSSSPWQLGEPLRLQLCQSKKGQD